MSAKHIQFVLIATCVSFLFSCSSSDSVKLIDRNFEDEIKLKQNLIFTFDQTLASDSVLNYWLEDDLIQIEPKVEGRFKWYSESVLIFSPAATFRPATSYTATLTPEITRATGLKLHGELNYTFKTPLLEPISITTYWKEIDNNTLAHISVAFNYTIDKQAIAKELELMVDGKKESFKVIEDSGTQKLLVYAPNLSVVDSDTEIKVTLPIGLTPLNGTLGTEEPIIRNLILRSPFKVAITEVSTEHNGMEGTLQIEMTQQVGDNAKKFISITPVVPIDIEETASGLTIKSEDFDPAIKYSLKLIKGLKGKFGGSLQQDYVEEISFGKLRPEIGFVNNRGLYLGAKGHKNIQVKIINVKKVKVTITKLYENNYLAFTSNQHYDYNTDTYGYNYYDLNKFGDVLLSKEYEVKSLPKQSGYRVLNLDFEDELDKYNGLYAIQVNSDEEYWLRDNTLVAISDLGMITKVGLKHVSVFVNSIKNANPVGNVDVSFYGKNNQLIGQTKSDENGMAIFNYPENIPNGFSLSMITTKTSDDYNILTLKNTAINTSKFDIGGKMSNKSGYDVFVYGDRDIYRPGETVFLSGVVRDQSWGTPQPVPLVVKIVNSMGREIKSYKKILNKFGSFELKLDLSPSAPTGSYTVRLYTGNDIFLKSQNFKVEEFMPDRIKLDVEIDNNAIDIDESSNINVTATNFFGPPAANRNYEISIASRRQGFYNKDYRRFSFRIQGSDGYFKNKVLDGITDQNGKFEYSYRLEKQYKNMGKVQSDIYVTVFDETGRPVNRKETITISTQNTYYGINSEDYYTATDSEVNFEYIGLDKNGNPLSDVEAQITLIKHEYKTVLSKSGGYFRYRSQKVENELETQKVILNGKPQKYSFVPRESGRYEVRIRKPGISTYVSQSIYAYGWGSTTANSFEVDPEGQIDITLDKSSYEVGETANVILKAPFSGKVLVTLETDKVLDYFYVDTDKRAASFPIQIKSEHLPNVYLTATLFKPHAQTDLPLTVAHGATSIMVKDNQLNIPVEISASTESRSNTTQTIKVKGAPNSAITLAVVDEGILQLTGYSTPNPYKYFYRKRGLEVRTYDIYPMLYPEINLEGGIVGGGASMEAQLAKRINPLANDRIKLVSFWSGIMETDGSGNAELKIEIPQFSGSLRIMAANYTNNRFGSTSANIQVADPIVISSALPRFLSPGDTSLMPVNITNTTGKSTMASVHVDVSGLVKIVGDAEQSIAVEANSESQYTFKLVADQALGQSSVNVKVNALGESFNQNTNISVRPASPLQKESGGGSVNGGTAKNLTLGGGKFIPNSTSHKLLVASSPMAEFTKDLDYLVRYPYGCVEQTVSAVFPQLYFNDLVKATLSGEENTNTSSNIINAINKLKSMQLHHGGLTYWSGRGRESWWGSVYAAHFITEAKQAGFEIDDSFHSKLLNYVKTQLQSRKTVYYYFSDSERRSMTDRAIPYSLYVLALAGKPHKSTMNYYKSNTNDLTLDGKYLLASAYALIGDMKSYKNILPPAFKGPKSKREFGGSFSSYIRDEALALNTLLTVDKDNPQIPEMARHITNYLKSRRWLSTQERVFSFLALGKIAQQNAGKKVAADVLIDGKKIASLQNKTVTIEGKQFTSDQVSIKSTGDGAVYFFWESEGITADGSYKQKDSYLKVRKSYYTRDGRQITNGHFEQNDLIVVRLNLQSASSERVENVALTDILPAGFEIENPRITDVPGINWLKNKGNYQHMDVRDDRITFFVTSTGQQKNYYYLVRAVTKGTFQVGPAAADAMYNGEYHSYHGGGTVIIE